MVFALTKASFFGGVDFVFYREHIERNLHERLAVEADLSQLGRPRGMGDESIGNSAQPYV